jgi:hypothetical protein
LLAADNGSPAASLLRSAPDPCGFCHRQGGRCGVRGGLGKEGAVPLAADRDASGRGLPRLSLTVAEACDVLGVSWDFWTAQVAPEVRVVRRGRRKLVPVAELERWLDANAELALPDGTGRVAP